MTSPGSLAALADAILILMGEGTLSRPQSGRFVISLDFELMWGVRDKRSIADYGRNILGVRQAVPALLALFAEHNIACTWATVGMLFFANKRDLLAGLPEQRPRYTNPRLSPYETLSEIGDNEDTDPYWYGLSMIERIMDCPRQEIGTHTSHIFTVSKQAAKPKCSGRIWKLPARPRLAAGLTLPASHFRATRPLPRISPSAAILACGPFAATSASGFTAPAATRIRHWCDAAFNSPIAIFRSVALTIAIPS